MKKLKKRPILKAKKKVLSKTNEHPYINMGWVPLKRELLDSPIMANHELCRLYVWCLLRANHKEKWISLKTGKGATEILVKRGTFITGRNKCAEALDLPPSTIRNFLKKLEKYGWIKITPKRHYSVIGIIDYEVGQAKNNDPTSNEQLIDTNNNDKKEKS